MSDFLHSQGMKGVMVDSCIKVTGIHAHMQLSIHLPGTGKWAILPCFQHLIELLLHQGGMTIGYLVAWTVGYASSHSMMWYMLGYHLIPLKWLGTHGWYLPLDRVGGVCQQWAASSVLLAGQLPGFGLLYEQQHSSSGQPGALPPGELHLRRALQSTSKGPSHLSLVI